MIKKIYLEECVDRASLKAFVGRVFKLSGLHLTVFNERGEAVVGDHETVLGGAVEPADLTGFSDGGIMMRPDGSLLKVVKLEWRGSIYGAVLVGPYVVSSSGVTDATAGRPRITDDQVDAVTEMVEHFFQQQTDMACEREALRRKEKILSVLEEASNIMNSTLDFQNLLDFMMDIAIDITSATSGSLLLRKDKKRYLEVVVARGAYPQEVKKIRVPIGQGITGWVAKNREPLVVPNVLLEPRYIETPESIYSEMAVPLTVGDKLIGVITVDSSEINAFSKDDCTTLNTLASMVTKVLENARLLTSSNQQVREMTNLFAISEKFSERSGDPGLLDEVVSDIAAALACSGVSLMLYNGDRDDLYLKARVGLPEELENLRIPLGKGIHGYVAQQRKSVLISDVTHDVNIVKYSFLDHFSRSVLAVPLSTREQLIGVLSAYQKKDSTPFSEADEKLLTTIGRLLTSHFENRRLFDDSRRKLEYLTTLYKISSSVSKTLNIVRLFNMILQQVQDVMDVENCSLMAYDPIRNVLSLDAAIGMPKNLVGRVFVPLGEGVSGWVAQQKQPVLIKDISKDERFANRAGRLEYTTRSVLSVPILHNKVLLGVLNVNNKRSGSAFTEDDLNLLLSISGQISQAIANANLYERTEQQVAELSLIQELGKAINSSLDLDSVLTYFIDMTTRITDSDRATLMLYSKETDELHVQVSRGFDDVRIKDVRFKLGEGIAGQAAKQRKPLRVGNTVIEPQFKKLPLDLGTKPITLISAPLLNRDNLVGVINCERELDKKGPFLAENLDLLDTLASQASVAIENARLYNNLLNVYLETIRALAAAIDAKDSYTHGHSRRVTDLSVSLALAMGLPRSEVDTIRHAALLHDVGKIGISEQILLKPGRLTDEEFETIKSHPHIGAGILNSIEFLKNVCMIIEHHHERYDGKGYPSNLKGDGIPVGARIIMVADSFDAITSCRPYRKPLTFDEAMAEVGRCAGSQFDPQVVSVFVKLRESTFCPLWLKAASLEEAERKGATADPTLTAPDLLRAR